MFLDKDTSLDVLYPFEKLFSEKFAGDVNDTSVAAVLSFGNKKFLLAGDAGLMEEAGLVNSGADIDIDVLKLNHHGSKYANSRLFWKRHRLKSRSFPPAKITVTATRTKKHWAGSPTSRSIAPTPKAASPSSPTAKIYR